MFAVIRTGGKQYRVAEGQILRVEKLAVDAGTTIELTDVLMINTGGSVVVGTPTVTGAKVVAEVRTQGRAKKVEIVKFRRRKHSRKHQGHRQHYTELKIASISV